VSMKIYEEQKRYLGDTKVYNYMPDDVVYRPPWGMGEPEPPLSVLYPFLYKTRDGREVIDPLTVYIGRTAGKKLFAYNPRYVVNPLVLVVGTPGSGKSLHPDERVLVVRDGLPMVVPIREARVGDLVVSVSGDLTVRLSRVLDVIAHHHSGTLLRIMTESGREVLVTPDHSVVSVKEGRLVSVKASELKPGNVLLLPRWVSPTLVEELDGVKLTPSTGYILGLYVARGRAVEEGGALLLSNLDPATQGRLLSECAEAKVECRESGRGVEVLSPELAAFAAKWFGAGPRRRLPEWVLFSPPGFRLALVAGMFDGKGYIKVGTQGGREGAKPRHYARVEYYTASKELADGLALLLLFLGIASSKRVKRRPGAPGRTLYRVYVVDKREFAERVPAERLKPVREELLQSSWQNRQRLEHVPVSLEEVNRYAAMLRPLSHKPGARMKVKDVRKRARRGTLTREGLQGFVEFLKAYGVDAGGLERYLRVPLVFDRVERVEAVEYEGPVYDISTEDETFMTWEGVFVHNSATLKTFIYNLLSNEVFMPEGKVPPVVVVDPEGEYHVIGKMVGRENVLHLRLGRGDYINIFDRPTKTINPFSWYMRMLAVIQKFLGLTPAQGPQAYRVLKKAIIEVAKEKGITFDPTTWTKPDITLEEVFKWVETQVESLEKKKRMEQAERTFHRAATILLTRMDQWMYPPNDAFSKQSTISLHKLFDYKLAILDARGLAKDLFGVFTYWIVYWTYGLMLERGPLPEFGIRMVLVIDEAWALLRKSERREEENPLEALARRGRKYGILLVVATQTPEDMDEKMFSLFGTLVAGLIPSDKMVEKLVESRGMPKRFKEILKSLPQGTLVWSINWVSKGFPMSRTPIIVHTEYPVKKLIQIT